MGEHQHPTPMLVLVGGKPGTGKTTLAYELSRPERLGLPLLSRDLLKVGLVETFAFAERSRDREVIESDERRASTVPTSFSVFYDTIGEWLRAGVSLIAEFGFDSASEASLRPLVRQSIAMFVVCEVADEVALERYVERERGDRRHRPDRLEMTLQRSAAGEGPWVNQAIAELDVPTIRVDTSDGYRPSLDRIEAFCRDVPR